jgi:hypothetical protein
MNSNANPAPESRPYPAPEPDASVLVLPGREETSAMAAIERMIPIAASGVSGCPSGRRDRELDLASSGPAISRDQLGGLKTIQQADGPRLRDTEPAVQPVDAA